MLFCPISNHFFSLQSIHAHACTCADDPRTQWNAPVFERLRKADRVVVCGQALSHCVAFTCRDLVSRWPKEEMHKLVGSIR